MKVWRLLVALLLSISLFSASPAFAAVKPLEHYNIGDVDESYRFYDAIERFVYSDVIDGFLESEVYEDEETGEVHEYTYLTVRPDEKVTRAQFTKILVSALSLQTDSSAKAFPDVKSSKWHYNYIRTASSLGIIAGYQDGNFYPDRNITREQMAAMIYRAFSSSVEFKATAKTFKDVPSTSFAKEAIDKLAANSILQGFGDTFKPQDLATRGQAIAIIDRAMSQEKPAAVDTAAIESVVTRNVTTEIDFTNAQDMAALEALYQETATGQYLAYSLETLALDDLGMGELDGTFALKQEGEHTLSIASQSKRFAQVRMNNLFYRISFTSPDLDFSMKVNMSGTAHLKKDAAGQWKIYSVVLDQDFEYMDELEAEIASVK